MSKFSGRLINPIFIPIVSVPHFIFGALLAAYNWNRLGFPGKARNTVIYSIFAAIALIIIAFMIPVDTLQKMWSIGVGINIGAGMAFRTLQMPEYVKTLNKM